MDLFLATCRLEVCFEWTKSALIAGCKLFSAASFVLFFSPCSFHSGALLSYMETVLLLLMQRKTGIYNSFSRKLQQISFLFPPVNRLKDNSTWIVGEKTQSGREKQAKLSSSGHFCSFSTSDTSSVSIDAWNLPSSSRRPRRRRSPGYRLAVSQESQSSCLALTEDAEQSQ